MTLKTRMASDVSDVFLRTDDFATDEVVRYPRGNRSVGSAIAACIVDLDNETGTGDAVNTTVGVEYLVRPLLGGVNNMPSFIID